MTIDSSNIGNNVSEESIKRLSLLMLGNGSNGRSMDDLIREYNTLSGEEQEKLLNILRECKTSGFSTSLDSLWQIDFDRKPVPFEEWVEDPYYMGKLGDDLYPIWKKELNYILHPSSRTVEWALCVGPETPVALCDGSTPTIKELSEKSEKEFWVWSYDPNSERVVPALATNPRKTGKKKLLRVWLDNGTFFDATPDHPMMCRSGLKQVQDIKPREDSLLPVHRRLYHGRSMPNYRQILQPVNGKWEYEHRVVAGELFDEDVTERRADRVGKVIHHVDFNKYNNDPSNLRIMWADEHSRMHSEVSKEFHRLNPERRKLFADRMSKRNAGGLAKRGAEASSRKLTSKVTLDDITMAFDSGVRTVVEMKRVLGISMSTVSRVLRRAGYPGGWKEYKNSREINFNHKIDRVEDLGECDVYCLTVPSTSLWCFATRNRVGTPQGNDLLVSHNTGSIGIGKCVHEDCLVYTSEGLLTSRELYGFVTSGKEIKVLSESGMKKVSEGFDEGIKDSIRIETHSGGWDENTPHHMHRVLTESFSIEWKRNDELKVGDYVIRKPGNDEVFGKNEIDSDLSWLVGLWVAEGWWIGDSSRSVRLCNTNIDLVEGILRKTCSEFYRIDSKSRAPVWRVSGPLSEICRKEPTGAYNKAVPTGILTGTKNTVSSFLRGYFDGDGGISGVSIECSSVSRKLVDQIKNLLWVFGIKCRVSKRKTSCKTTDYIGYTYRLIITDKLSKLKFKTEIGFDIEYKKKKLEEITREKEYHVTPRNDNGKIAGRSCTDNDHEIIPYAKEAWNWTFKNRPKEFCTKSHPMYSRLGTIYVGRLISRKFGVTRKAIRNAAEICGDDHFHPVIKRIYREGLVFDKVVSIEKSKSHMFDFSVEGDPSYVANGFISHNTFVALIAILYKGAYICSCLKDPQKYFGLASDTEIVFAVFNTILDNASLINFRQVARFVKSSRYFQENCPPVIRYSKNQIYWPRKEMILRTGSSELHALGSNIFAYFMDEANFMEVTSKNADDKDKQQAYKIYNNSSRRMMSRYLKYGMNPGLAVIASSRLHQSSFLEDLIERNRRNPAFHLSDYSLWQVKSSEDYSPVTFRVLIGNEYKQSEVLDELDTSSGNPWTYERIKSKAKIVPDGMSYIEVPSDFYFQFMGDIDGALRDIAGVATYGVTPLIQRRETIIACRDESRLHPFYSEFHSLPLSSTEASLIRFMDWDKITKIEDGIRVPRFHGSQPRFVHCDLGLTKDAAAISMCCPYGVQKITKYNPESGQIEDEFLPKVWVDFMLRIPATSGDQIDISKIVSFIINLGNYGFSLQRVTFDGYASEMAVQIVKKASVMPEVSGTSKRNMDDRIKLESGVLSVDRTDKPYRVLRDMLSCGAISYYKYPWFETELRELSHDVKLGKVDHLPGGTKDCADAVCGAVYGVASSKAASFGGAPELETKSVSSESPEDNLIRDVMSGVSGSEKIVDIIPPLVREKRRSKKIYTGRSSWMNEIDGFGVHRRDI